MRFRTRQSVLSEQPEKADGDAARRAKSQAARAEAAREAERAAKEREKKKQQQEKEREQKAAEREKARDDRKAATSPERQDDRPQQDRDEQPPKPPPMKILKSIPSPERAEVDDRNYGIKGKKCADKPSKVSFERRDIIRRMFKARQDRLDHLKDVTRTSLDIALGVNSNFQAGMGNGLSSPYHRYR